MNTTAEKMIIAAKTIEHIENNSHLMQEIINVIRQGAITDLAKLLDHPSAPFLIVALETCHKKKEIGFGLSPKNKLINHQVSEVQELIYSTSSLCVFARNTKKG